MKITKLSDKRLLLEFPTKKEMILANFRIAEFYEGKTGIKGQYFTPDQFIDAYSDEEGNIDYFSYWEGFNFPKSILSDFVRKFGLTNITQRECIIFEAATQISPTGGYIISCVEGDDITIKHETAHALFFENEEYREKVTGIINTLDPETINKFKLSLSKMSYCEEVMIDEMQAYLVAFDQDEWDECFGDISEDEIYSHRLNLQATFDYYNK